MAYRLRSAEIVYGYAVGRVRVLEAALIDGARISRLIDAQDVEEMRAIMTETVYGPLLAGVDSIEGIEAALNRHLAQTYALAEDGIPSQMPEYFRSRHDFDNLRVLIKSGFGQELDVTLSDLGGVPADKAEMYTRTKSFTGFTEALREAAYAAIEVFERTGSFEEIDEELDRRYYETLRALSKGLYSVWISGYTKLVIDIANGRIAIRARAKGIAPVKITELLVAGGNIAIAVWRDWLTGVVESLIDPLDIKEKAIGPAGDVRTWKEAVQTAVNDGVTEYESRVIRIFGLYLHTARQYANGSEPLFAYIAKVEREVRLLRTVMMARINGIESLKLREQLKVVI
jgi:V/A-type H+-transporting ATPase subunit C